MVVNEVHRHLRFRHFIFTPCEQAGDGFAVGVCYQSGNSFTVARAAMGGEAGNALHGKLRT